MFCSAMCFEKVAKDVSGYIPVSLSHMCPDLDVEIRTVAFVVGRR